MRESSLRGRGKSAERSRFHKTVNIGFDYKTYCRMKVVAANTGKSMKTLLVESFCQVYGQPTDEDVAIVLGQQPAPKYQTIKPVAAQAAEPKVVYDSFTGLPIEAEAAEVEVEKPRLEIENPVANRLFRREM